MPLILTPLRFPQFRLWMATGSVSVIGTWMQVLAANWLLLTATGSAAQMGLGMCLQALPTLLLGPWGGALADRLPAKPLLATTHLMQSGIAVTLGLVALTGGQMVFLIYGAMLLNGAIAAVEGPVLGRFGSLMVDRDHLAPALAANSLANAGGRVIGMSLGGVLTAAVGPTPLFLINSVTLLTVVAVLRWLHPVPGALEPTPAEAEELAANPPPATALGGLRRLLRDPMVVTTLLLAFLLGSLGRNYQVTMATMSEGPLAGGANGYGTLSTVFAIGTVVGGALAGRAGRFRPRHLVAVGLTMSVLQGLSAMSPAMWSFAAILLPIAAAAVLFDTAVMARLQLDQPLALRGRVLAALGATGASAGAVGAPLLGWLSDALGARGALGVAGVTTVLGCVTIGTVYLHLRRRSRGGPPVRVQVQEQVQERVAREPVPAAA